jgi:retinol-binding protein 3
MKPFARVALAAAGLLVPMIAAAQVGGPVGEQPDRTIDAATRKTVIDSLTAAVERFYVFPDKGKETSRALAKRFAAKQYDRITSAREFADSLTQHLQAVTHDLHLRVHYRNDPFPKEQLQQSASERARALQSERYRNFGFDQVKRLAGNVGYLDLRMFSGQNEAVAVAHSAMQFLGSADALIVDLRRNGGGSPAMIATLLTYLVDEDARLNFNNFFQRRPDGDVHEQWWTLPHVPGQRLAGKPVYVLTSSLTGSAAEEFAYDVQTHELGTLVGAVTAGAAHPGGLFRLDDHFAAFIATGRAINPVTKTNWEGVGVKPHVAVAPEEALRAAHVAAIEKLLAKPRDDEHKAALEGALAVAKESAIDKPEDFQRRRGGAQRVVRTSTAAR